MYQTDEARDKTPQALFHASECRCEVVRDAPVQTTDCDCAVLVCAIAEHLSAGRAATFSQDNVPDMYCRMLLAFSSTTSSEQASAQVPSSFGRCRTARLATRYMRIK